MQEQKFKDKWGIKLFIRTALNTWEVNLTYKQELLCLNHIKSSWRRLPSSTQKSLYLWSFPYIINILRSHLLLVLDIHWKNLSYWVTESNMWMYKSWIEVPKSNIYTNSRMFHFFPYVLLYSCKRKFYVTPPCSQIFI